MIKVVGHLLLLFGIPVLYFGLGTVMNGFRERLHLTADWYGAKNYKPAWGLAAVEAVLIWELTGKGPFTWIVNHIIPPLQEFVQGGAYKVVLIVLMVAALLSYIVKRKNHIFGEALLGLLEIPMMLISLLTFGSLNRVYGEQWEMYGEMYGLGTPSGAVEEKSAPPQA